MNLTLPKIHSGDQIRLPSGMIAISPGEISLIGVEDVSLIGATDTVLSCQSTESAIIVRNSNRIKLEGFTVSGPGPLVIGPDGIRNEVYSALIELQGVNKDIAFNRIRCLNGPNHGVAHLKGDRTSSNVIFTDCYFENGGNYATKQALAWDGAAVAVGGLSVSHIRTRIVSWLRGIESENPSSDCSFIIDGCTIYNCPHAAVWITPTGFLNGIKGQKFSGSITNSRIGPGRKVPNGFSSAGIVCTGGDSIIVSGVSAFGFPDGCGIQFSADTAPLNRVSIINNQVSGVGRSGILYRHGSEGTKDRAAGLVCVGNLLSGIVGTPIDIDVDGVIEQANNLILP